MKAWVRICACVVLVLMIGLTSVGYAALTDTLRTEGTASVSIPSGLFIIAVKTIEQSSVDKNQVSYVEYSTTLDSLISRSGNNAGSVTYHITVLNNTKLTYSYRGIYYQSNLSGYNGNSLIKTSNDRQKIGVVCSLASASAEDKKVAPGEKLEFTVTYTVGNRLGANNDYKTLINFQFGINVDGEREALEVIESKFLNILNTPSTYETLIDSLDNKFDGRMEWTSNYIGNVVGSSSQDSVAVNTLFAGQLQITVGGSQSDATVLIKHENLDGNVNTGDDYVATNSSNGGVFRGYGCEMTLYLTVDPLNTAGRYVPVYVVVFTCDRDENGNIVGGWYRIGDTYAGEANVVTYDGGNGTGSFVTDNWRADRETYKLIDGYSYDIGGEIFQIDGYSYTVGEDVSIKSIVSIKDSMANETFIKLLDDAKRLIDNNIYAGLGIEVVEEAYSKFSSYYTVDETGKHTIEGDTTLVKISPAIKELYRTVNDALLKIEALSQQQN